MINELYDTKEQAFEAGKMVGRLGLDDWAKKRIAELEAALEPFARMSDSYDDEPASHVIASKRGTILSVYDLRLAKAAGAR